MVGQSVDERLEALENQQEEFDLLKTEIKQTLVDIKEALIKGDATFFADVAPPQISLLQSVSNEELSPVLDEQPEDEQPEDEQPEEEAPSLALSESASSLAEETEEAPDLQIPFPDYRYTTQPAGNLDTTMMGNVIWWLGTAKSRGLTLQLLAPILEAYETSGRISPSLGKMILRSMADLDSRHDGTSADQFSPKEYAGGLHQLHEIICTPGYVLDDQIISNVPALEEQETPALTGEIVPESLVSEQDQEEQPEPKTTEPETTNNPDNLGIRRDAHGRFQRTE